MNDLSDPWEYDGRYYLVTEFSDVSRRDGLGLELEDVAPTPGRGNVLEAFRDDTAGTITIAAFTDQPLPLALVHRFVTEAARELAPDA
nr:hypothetical protein [Kibdelosporangium sp. MJ126-NF4]CEL17928.1 hypothetical protein [Kibdelosporangium sp. MJ126-NF4]CEL22679.1 hypothetical protein [Kibdelosporangium sp. MJ126-NF4]CTQ89820.1 hypothetical protein [Kibdelosporangium sp. MJ126-NF4]CTQ90846.1 hypothetical protein [Kibdelosporangium sp. MJ126-NF4]